mmetsp:Transcript_24483/g.65742  ORF Transcript_24483/g.65742 Transcript_24483/m.65742 type:complete len:286 (-) Transcript_24483:989-1846(-)
MLHLVDRVYPFALDHASHTRQLPHSHLAAARRRARRCPVLPAEQRGGDARVLGLHDLDDVADLLRRAQIEDMEQIVQIHIHQQRLGERGDRKRQRLWWRVRVVAADEGARNLDHLHLQLLLPRRRLSIELGLLRFGAFVVGAIGVPARGSVRLLNSRSLERTALQNKEGHGHVSLMDEDFLRQRNADLEIFEHLVEDRLGDGLHERTIQHVDMDGLQNLGRDVGRNLTRLENVSRVCVLIDRPIRERELKQTLLELRLQSTRRRESRHITLLVAEGAVGLVKRKE